MNGQLVMAQSSQVSVETVSCSSISSSCAKWQFLSCGQVPGLTYTWRKDKEAFWGKLLYLVFLHTNSAKVFCCQNTRIGRKQPSNQYCDCLVARRAYHRLVQESHNCIASCRVIPSAGAIGPFHPPYASGGSHILSAFRAT